MMESLRRAGAVAFVGFLVSLLAPSAVAAAGPALREQAPGQSRQPCFGPMPADWSERLARTSVNLGNRIWFPETLGRDSIAYGAFQDATENGVAAVRLGDGQFSVIDAMPSTSSPTWMSFADPWLVWVQADDPFNLGVWSMHAWNSRTGEKLLLASANTEADLTFPVVTHDYVAWSQPISQASAQLRVFNLETHRSRILDAGHLSSPVIAGHNLVWAKFTVDQSQSSFRMVDAETFEPVPVPARLAAPQSIVFLAGSPEYLVWTGWIIGTAKGGPPAVTSSLTAYRLSDRSLTEYVQPQADYVHTFQFPQLAGEFVVWFTSVTYSVLDLETGAGFDAVPPGQIVGAGRTMVFASYASAGKGVQPPTTVSTIRLSSGLDIPPCSAQ